MTGKLPGKWYLLWEAALGEGIRSSRVYGVAYARSAKRSDSAFPTAMVEWRDEASLESSCRKILKTNKRPPDVC